LLLETEMLPWTEYTNFAISLFAILTPFVALPAFLSLTAGLDPNERSRVATVAALTAALVLVVAAVLGKLILAAFGTSIGSLRVGGGLVLLLMAFSALNPREASFLRPADPGRSTVVDRQSGGIVPLGLPLLAGPGSISSVIVEMRHGAGLGHEALVIACILATCSTAWGLLRLAQPIGRRIGPSGLTAMSRLFGLLLAAVAVEVITDGLRALFPILH
jgi:multiple antibiotic resistance protein